MADEFITMTEIGKLYGVSSHVVGRWLREIGMRSDFGQRPRQDAIDGGYCRLAPTGRGTGYFWVWHKRRILAALEAAGHCVEEPEPQIPITDRLVGPFNAQQSSNNGYEIIGGDGAVAIWAFGEDAARLVVKLLNLADDHGQL